MCANYFSVPLNFTQRLLKLGANTIKQILYKYSRMVHNINSVRVLVVSEIAIHQRRTLFVYLYHKDEIHFIGLTQGEKISHFLHASIVLTMSNSLFLQRPFYFAIFFILFLSVIFFMSNNYNDNNDRQCSLNLTGKLVNSSLRTILLKKFCTRKD